jgi:predicted O-methyltransferase YrrM
MGFLSELPQAEPAITTVISPHFSNARSALQQLKAPIDLLMRGLGLTHCRTLTTPEQQLTNLVQNTTCAVAIADFMNRWPVFTAIDQDFQQIHGWLSCQEARTLLLLAAYAPLDQPIVEIGSFKGLSTCYLALGSALAARGPLTAIDHFRGSPEHQLGQFEQVAEIVANGSTFETFHNNLHQRGLWPMVKPMVMTAAAAASHWQGPIGLLFLDAEHTWEATERDFNLFAPFVVPGGLVAFHDAENDVWPEVRDFYSALVAQPGWMSVLAADTMRVAIKLT